MTKIEEAVAAFKKACADYDVHAAEAKALKELEVVARHTGGDIAAAEEAYARHQDNWHILYRAQNDTGKAICDAMGLTSGERYILRHAVA